jgi:hypothetical protein
MFIHLLIAASIVASVLLVNAVRKFAGAIAALATATLCVVGMAYFVIPPVFSLRIGRMHDLFPLVMYGLWSVTVVAIDSRNRRTGFHCPTPAAPPDVWTASALLGGEVRSALSARGLPLRLGAFDLPLNPRQSAQLISDILTFALETDGPQLISIDGGTRPGSCLLTLTAHRVWPPPPNERITIGQHANKCTPLHFETWPPSIHATWFDTEYDRIIQLSLPVRA